MTTKTQFATTDTVERIYNHDGSESHIEPQCEPSWPALDKLRWHAAVVLADTGLRLRVHTAAGSAGTKYAVTGGGYGGSYMTYNEAWRYITDLGKGAAMLANQYLDEAIETINLEE